MVDQLLRQSRHLRRAREGRRHRDGQQRHRARARHHHPGQELRGELEGHAHQHRRHPRPRGLRRRGRARAVDGRRRGAADRRPGRPDAADPLRHQEGAGAGPASPSSWSTRSTSRAPPEYVVNAAFDLFDKLGATDEQLDFPVVYASGINGWSLDGRGRAGREVGPRHVGPVRHRAQARAGRTRAIRTRRCSCRSRRWTTPPSSAASAWAASTQGTIKPMMDVHGHGRPGRQVRQGPHQPGADLPGPGPRAGHRSRPRRDRADQRHRPTSASASPSPTR